MTFDWWICRRGHIVPDGEDRTKTCPVFILAFDRTGTNQGRVRYVLRRCRCKLERLSQGNYERTWDGHRLRAMLKLRRTGS